MCSSSAESSLFLENYYFLLGNALVLAVFNTRSICLVKKLNLRSYVHSSSLLVLV